jgi:predicted nucleic acid-binding Zn ribbon protein
MSQDTQERTDSCPICEGPIPAPQGPGRPRTYCSDKCRLENQRQVYRAKVRAEVQAAQDEADRLRGYRNSDLDMFGRLKSRFGKPLS